MRNLRRTETGGKNTLHFLPLGSVLIIPVMWTTTLLCKVPESDSCRSGVTLTLLFKHQALFSSKIQGSEGISSYHAPSTVIGTIGS